MAAGADIDLRTVQARLEQRAQMEGVGGVAYLAGLDVDLPDLGRVSSYVEIVKERSLRRRLIAACGLISRDCLDGGLEAQHALGRAEEMILNLGEEAIPRGFQALGEVFRTTLADLEAEGVGSSAKPKLVRSRTMLYFGLIAVVALVTLLHGLAARRERRGIATLCVSGGMGLAALVERA